MQDDVRRRTLQRAAEIMGGEESLAFRLGVTPSHLALWIKGLAEPPAGVFLSAVDIVLEDRKAAQASLQSSNAQGTNPPK